MQASLRFLSEQSMNRGEDRILVVGGAGYIGSHLLKCLNKKAYTTVTLDNLSNGHADAVGSGRLIVGDMGDMGLIEQLLSSERFDAVMHFASFIQVGESVRNPAAYYHNNFVLTKQLVDALLRHGIQRFIFSSTAAVYGTPSKGTLTEEHPCQPINPYGRSKWMVEQLLRDYDAAYGLKSVSLRYFNAAGADPDGELGERHDPETHLIPLALRAVAGTGAPLTVHGADYPTPDGSCIRDYIHVTDLAEAHALALRHLLDGGSSHALNLGNGRGYSVFEILDAIEAVTGDAVPHQIGVRRAGDPARLVADATLAQKILGWTPRHSELHDLLTDAWRWEQKRRGRAPPDP